jgi:two-component system, chemotaxis family, chemotaxis protein CheY
MLRATPVGTRDNQEGEMSTILIVDDDQACQRLSSFILAADHTVITADDGSQALDRLAHSPVDLVITDLAMPVMDGLALLRHVRATLHYASLPVIVMTSSTHEQDHRRVCEAGADAFMPKPAEPDDLLGLVRDLLSKTRPRLAPPLP